MLDKEIWNMLVSRSNDTDFGKDCDPEYKQQLIEGYKIILRLLKKRCNSRLYIHLKGCIYILLYICYSMGEPVN